MNKSVKFRAGKGIIFPDMIYKRKISLYWGVFILYVAVILLLATKENINAILPHHSLLRSKTHEIAHFFFFGGFAWLILLGLNLKNEKVINLEKSSYCAAFFSALFFGVFIELLQTFTLTRSARIHDIVFNALGISSALLIAFILNFSTLKRQNRKKLK